MDASDAIALASTIIAGLALALSMYVLYMQRKDGLPKLQIIAPTSVPRYKDEDEEHDPVIFFLLSNSGARPIYITELALYGADSGLIAPLRIMETKLPYKLEPWESKEITCPLDSYVEQMVQTAIEEGDTQGFIVIHDGTWQAYRCEDFDLNVDDDSVISREPFYATCPNHPEEPGFIVKTSIRHKE